jgi:hypothetical protein
MLGRPRQARAPAFPRGQTGREGAQHGIERSLGVFVCHAKPMRHAGAKGLVVHARQVEDSVDLGHALTEVLGQLGLQLGHGIEWDPLFDRRDYGDDQPLCFVTLASELVRNLVDELHE